MIKAILFDMDGVLVDACEWHYQALNESLKYYTGKIISNEEHVTKFNGLPTKVKLKMLNIPAELVEPISTMKQAKTIEKINSLAVLDKYKQRMLDRLKIDGLLLGCVTNSIRKTTERMLEKTGQLKYLDVVITNEDVEKNKPFPDCYLLAFEKLKLRPSNCLVVEDSPKGISSATASGANVLKVEDVYDVTYDLIRRQIK